jgi:hypothetical protein
LGPPDPNAPANDTRRIELLKLQVRRKGKAATGSKDVIDTDQLFGLSNAGANKYGLDKSDSFSEVQLCNQALAPAPDRTWAPPPWNTTMDPSILYKYSATTTYPYVFPSSFFHDNTCPYSVRIADLDPAPLGGDPMSQTDLDSWLAHASCSGPECAGRVGYGPDTDYLVFYEYFKAMNYASKIMTSRGPAAGCTPWEQNPPSVITYDN